MIRQVIRICLLKVKIVSGRRKRRCGGAEGHAVQADVELWGRTCIPRILGWVIFPPTMNQGRDYVKISKHRKKGGHHNRMALRSRRIAKKESFCVTSIRRESGTNIALPTYGRYESKGDRGCVSLR